MWVMGSRNSDVEVEAPLTVPFRSMVQIQQRGKRLLVSIHDHRLAHLLVGLADEAAAAGLKADLEAGQVRLLRYGGVINELVLFPNCTSDSRGERGFGCVEVGAQHGGLADLLAHCVMLGNPDEVAAELARRWIG